MERASLSQIWGLVRSGLVEREKVKEVFESGAYTKEAASALISASIKASKAKKLAEGVADAGSVFFDARTFANEEARNTAAEGESHYALAITAGDKKISVATIRSFHSSNRASSRGLSVGEGDAKKGYALIRYPELSSMSGSQQLAGYRAAKDFISLFGMQVEIVEVKADGTI